MVLRDKNNVPINLGDVVIIHQDGILYGDLGIVDGLFRTGRSCELIYGSLHGTESIITLDPFVIEVIDTIDDEI